MPADAPLDLDSNLDDLLDVSECNTIEQIEDRRVSLLDAMNDVIARKQQAQSEMSAALASYRAGYGGKPHKWRAQRAERISQCKIDGQAINAAMSELRMKQKALVTRSAPGEPTGKYKLRRVAFHVFALLEREHPAMFRDMFSRAMVKAISGEPVVSPALAELGEIEPVAVPRSVSGEGEGGGR
jgi:hypothetical protein